MVIHEHVKGTIVIPIYDDNGDFANRTADIDFTEEDIIKGSCTITARACDDNTFSLGGVRSAELSIKLRLDGEEVNAYNLYGAKITLFSCYKQNPTASDWVFRGFYWVTSVSHVKNIYTLRASDAVIWLDSGSYVGNGTSVKETNAKTAIDKELIGKHRTLNDNLEKILELSNKELKEMSIDEIGLYKLEESLLEPQNLTGIFRNNSPRYPENDDIRLYGILDQNDGYFNSQSPSEYAKALAELYAGFITGRNCTENTEKELEQPRIQIIPFGYFNESQGYGALSIKYSEIECDSLNIAGYKLYFQNTYVRTFDETTWSSYSAPQKYGGNVTIDITDNTFLNGRHHGLQIYDRDHKTNLCNDPACNVFEVSNVLGEYVGTLKARPFSLKCHKVFQDWKEYPKLGMQIKIEDKDGKIKDSIITKAIWKFRGGWELGCTGSDNRVLSQAAKKSLASHASNTGKTYTNTVASRLDNHVKAAQTKANDAASAAKDAATAANDAATAASKNLSDIQNLENNKVDNTEFENAINALWDEINKL